MYAHRNDASLILSLGREPVEARYISSIYTANYIRLQPPAIHTRHVKSYPSFSLIFIFLSTSRPFSSTSRILNCRTETRAFRYNKHRIYPAQSSPFSVLSYTNVKLKNRAFISGCASCRTIDTERPEGIYRRRSEHSNEATKVRERERERGISALFLRNIQKSAFAKSIVSDVAL